MMIHLLVALMTIPFPGDATDFADVSQDTLACPDTSAALAKPAYREFEVQQPVRPASLQYPVYPAERLGSGVTGEVGVRYIVNTAGCIDPGSLSVLAATDSLFAEAARAALRRSRFHPAMREGKPVAQEVTQKIRVPPGRPSALSGR